MSVLLFDTETRSGLTALRELRRMGIEVTAASHKSNALSFYSRSTKKRFVHPNPATDRRAFLTAVQKYLAAHPATCIMSFTDVTTDALRPLREHVPGYRESTPSDDAYTRATDKRVLASVAKSCDIPVPEELAPESVTVFPVIVKPARTVSWIGDAAYKDTARVASDKASLERAIGRFREKGAPVLVQRMLQGDEYGVSLLAKEGKILALFAHHRLRSITPHGGVSTLRESVLVTEEMRTIAEKISRELSWTGVMMIELKRDNGTGKLTLIEINARFWGSLFLATTAGVHFPYALYLLASGRETSIPSYSYEEGIEARHIITDLSHFYALGTKAFTGKHLREFFTLYKKNLYYDVWSLKDPVPGFIELFQFIRKKL